MAVKNSLAAQGAAKSTMQDMVLRMEGQIKKALPSVMTPERFTRIALSALSNSPALCSCSPQSFLGAMMNAAQLGLEANTPLGHAYLIPYGNQCQFQVGYRGLIEIASRSQISVDAHEVRENDEFDYEYGVNPGLKHKPALKNRGEVIGYYAVYKAANGHFGIYFMPIEDVREFAKKYSKAYNSGPWKTDFDAMAKKTAIKQVLKYAPLKAEFARAIAYDETVARGVDADTGESIIDSGMDEYARIEPEAADGRNARDARDAPEQGEIIDGQARFDDGQGIIGEYSPASGSGGAHTANGAARTSATSAANDVPGDDYFAGSPFDDDFPGDDAGQR